MIKFIINENVNYLNTSLSMLDGNDMEEISNTDNAFRYISEIVDWKNIIQGETSFVSSYLIEFIKSTKYKNIHYVIDNLFKIMFHEKTEMKFVCLSAIFYHGFLCLTNEHTFYYFKMGDSEFDRHIVILKTNIEYTKIVASAVNCFEEGLEAEKFTNIDEFYFAIFQHPVL